MSKNSKKNYVRGSAKERSFGDGGAVINLDLNLSDLNSLPVTEKGYVKIVVAQRQAEDQYGNTHYVYENTFVPDPSYKKKEVPASSGPTVSKPTYDKGHPFG
jgi:hypothetical protein